MLGGPLEALFHIWPEGRNGEYLIRASSSGGVSAPGLPATKNAGLHGFFLIEDVSQSKAILDTLMERAWACGLGWIMLDVRGRMLKRGLIDVAVGTPERLIFEAPPVLHAPVTRQVTPPHINRGTHLPAPINDADVKARAEAAWSAAVAKHQPEAEIVKEKYIDDKATEQTKLNKRPYAENRERISRPDRRCDGQGSNGQRQDAVGGPSFCGRRSKERWNCHGDCAPHFTDSRTIGPSWLAKLSDSRGRRDPKRGRCGGVLAVYVPCDAPPAYWQRTATGDLTPASQVITEALHRHIGPPRPAQRPPLKPVSSRLRDALNPKPRRYVPNYEDQPF